jgi:predicted SprT family Zn-dependent metalloprotease
MVKNKEERSKREPLSLLTAIQNKKTIMINVKQEKEEDCEGCTDCSPPTYEEVIIDELSLVASNPASNETMIAFQEHSEYNHTINDETESEATCATQPTVLRIKDPPSVMSSPDSSSRDARNLILFDLSRMGISDEKGMDVAECQRKYCDVTDQKDGANTDNSADISSEHGRTLINRHIHDCSVETSSSRGLVVHFDIGVHTNAEEETTINNAIDDHRVEGIQGSNMDGNSSSGSTVIRFDLSFVEEVREQESNTSSAKSVRIEAAFPQSPSFFRGPSAFEPLDHTTTTPSQCNERSQVDSEDLLSPVCLRKTSRNNSQSVEDDLFDTPSTVMKRKPAPQINDDNDLVDTPSPDTKTKADYPNIFATAEVSIESSSDDDSSGKSWLERDDESGDENSWHTPTTKDELVQLGSESEEYIQWNEGSEQASDESNSVDDEPDDFIVLTSDNDSCRESDNEDTILPAALTTVITRKTKLPRTPASFRKNRDALTKAAFHEFNSNVFGTLLTNVKVEWSKKLRTTGGITHLKRVATIGVSAVHTASIELSEKVLDDEKRMRSTLIHEMCHAAAWLVDGVSKPAHGSVFKKWGKKATVRTGIIVTTTHDFAIQFKFAWACQTPNCGAVIQRHSRSVDVARHVCSRCKGKLLEIEAPR